MRTNKLLTSVPYKHGDKNQLDFLFAGNIGNDPGKNEIIGIYKVIDIKKSPEGLMDLYEIYDEFDFEK